MTKDNISQARAAYRSGDKSSALLLFTQAVRQNPRDEQAWMGIFSCVTEPTRRKYCLEKILEINPDNDKARQLLLNYSSSFDEDIFPASISGSLQKNINYPSAIITNADMTLERKKWYRHPAVKILTFLFFTPLWTIIVLDDPDSTISVKVVATTLLVLYVLACASICWMQFLLPGNSV